MSGPSPLDKLSNDVNQYRRCQVAGKRLRPVALSAPEGPGWTALDSNLSSQIVFGLMITGYAVAMLAATLAVILLQPGASIVLWPVMANGVLSAMIACHKGRPPLLWFMYGSIVPMIPLAHAALMSRAAASLGQLQGLLGGRAPSGSESLLDLLLCVCIVGAIPLVHAVLARQDLSVPEVETPAHGMKRCVACAEIIRQEAKLCRYCGKET